MTGLIIFLIILPILIWIIWRKKPGDVNVVLPSNYQDLLNTHVTYYRALTNADKQRFDDKIKNFLSYVRIHAVNTEIDDLDKLLVACSAIIPTFSFEWHYYNLSDVLIYADTFDEKFSIAAKDRNVSGMVGTGAMQRMMILSKRALREGFQKESSQNNAGIHEFVHLLDKADGATDGIPEALLSKQYTIPWINYMNDEIEKIKQGKSDINVYGATNKAEFFAVAAEYFFDKPDKFRQEHPELFDMMEKIFHQQRL